MKAVAILEFPSDLGLKPLYADTTAGVKRLPAWLKEHGFHQRIAPAIVRRLPAPQPISITDAETRVRNSDQLIAYAIEQQACLTELLREDYFSIILGGDCSIVIGSMLALKSMGSFGLFYLDGHTDFIGTDISQTAGAAGMCLAIAAGKGHDKLINIFNLKPYVEEKHIWCVGNREYDAAYVQPILDSCITYFDLKELRRVGLTQCVDSFLEMIRKEALDGFFIHLDVDVLDDEIMPAVDSRSPDGLQYAELKEILTPLVQHAVGIEITILDPDLDPDGKYTNEFVNTFTDIITAGRKDPN